jgi:uncharacterized protein YaiI (UPF0178 family)
MRKASRDIISLFIDAGVCPVKQELYRFAERHATAVDRSR